MHEHARLPSLQAPPAARCRSLLMMAAMEEASATAMCGAGSCAKKSKAHSAQERESKAHAEEIRGRERERTRMGRRVSRPRGRRARPCMLYLGCTIAP